MSDLTSISSTCFVLLQFSNKDAIAQDFVLHDTLLRGKSALEQISCGLANVGVLSLIHLFPMEFEPLFTHLRDEEVTSASLLTLFRFPDNLNDCQEATADMLREFIRSCSSEGANKLDFFEYIIIHKVFILGFTACHIWKLEPTMDNIYLVMLYCIFQIDVDFCDTSLAQSASLQLDMPLELSLYNFLIPMRSLELRVLLSSHFLQASKVTVTFANAFRQSSLLEGSLIQ